MGILRQVITAFRPSNVAQGLAAARGATDPAAMEAALASLTPEQRAAYDANMAAVDRGRAEAQAAWERARATEDGTRVLHGPAGRYVDGSSMADLGSPAELEARIADQGVLGAVGALRAQRKGELRDAVRQTFNRDAVPQVDDPAERVRINAAERAARDAARAPYLAPDAPAVALTRIATRGETQLAEVLAYLQGSGLGAHPERVYGVHRVPDRISGPLTPHSEAGRVVEWEVVHEPGAADGTPCAPLVATSFAAAEQWVARRVGEPSIVDEELPLAFCLEAGIGPEQSLGLARMCELRALRGHGGEDGSGDLHALVRGIVALHPPEGSGAFDRLRAAAPLELPAAPAGVHLEVLNWGAVAEAVHPRIHHPPPAPSPFPYLPATPQELLQAHLQVVGVRAADCYGAAATVHHPSPMVQGGLFTTNLGPRQPCADGKPRMRTRGAQHVVVAYRDRPEHATGRERWAAYERDVLQARLGNGLGLRTPVSDGSDLPELPKALRPAERVAETIDRFAMWGVETVSAYRYCWPPVT